MSTHYNPDAVSNQAPGGGLGEFHAKIQPDKPLTTSGHKPGINVGNDAVPEFHAQTLPAGTAPADKTFRPNPTSEVPPVAQQSSSSDEVDPEAPQTSASDTLPGATSADVHTGLGHPGQGQTSSELRHDGQHGRKRQPYGGLEGLASGAQGKTVDARDPTFAGQRALGKEEADVGRGNVGGLAAEEREPETAERVAAERE